MEEDIRKIMANIFWRFLWYLLEAAGCTEVLGTL